MTTVAKRVSTCIGCLALIFLIYEFFYLRDFSAGSISRITYIKLAIGLFSICSGIFISFYYADTKNTRPIIYFVYCLTITYSNIYLKNDVNPSVVKISKYVFDTFGTLTVVSLIIFLKNSYQTNSKSKMFAIITRIYCFIVSAIYLVKYLIISFSKKYDVFNCPLKYCVQIMLIIASLIMIIYFFYLLASSARQSTMLLRYLALGIFYAIFPFFIIMNKVLIRHQNGFNMTEIYSITNCFIYLPIILSCSVFQFKSEKVNKIIRFIIIFLGYATILALTNEMIYEDFSSRDFKVAATIIVMISPAFFYFVYFSVNRFLTLENRKLKKSLLKFQDELNGMVTSQESYLLTASQIKSILNCEYIFFATVHNNITSIPYTDTTEDIMNSQLQKESLQKGKKELTVFENGSFVLTYFQNKLPSIKMFVGPKLNKDQYLPSEFSITKRYATLVFDKVLSIYNQTLSTELKEVSEHSKKLDKELLLASYVQKSFYPQKIENPKGWKLEFYCKAMASVSGDLYDFFMTGDNLDGLGIFDVSGHGISSGLVAMLVRNIIHQEFYKNKEKSMDQVLKIIDNRFRAEKNNIENFMTGIMLRIDGNNIQLVNGAHPDPIIYRKADNSVKFLNNDSKKRGSIIGFEGIKADFSTLDFTMESGDELILYTDGINEAVNENRQQYGLKRLMEIATENINQSTENQMNLLLNDLQKFVGNAPANDDITVIILQKE